ncbi:MAG: hypothetical protein IPH86_13835 [bacterium]|nr:hypothetical protein [bacterium]
MRRSLLMLAVLALLVAAGSAFAATTVIRTGQVGGVPGNCGGNDDLFRFYAPNQTCGQPILPTPFAPADFAAACAGPPASVIDTFGSPWIASLPCDPAARWIATGRADPVYCLGADVSTLFCAPFDSECAIADSIRICWAADDFLGDVPSFPGPNPGGIYINGVDLGPAFSGPGSNPQYTAVAYNVPLTVGANTLSVYQRDAGCGIAGLVLSATVYTDCAIVPTESTTWGSVKSTFR